ncbi:hypothetical protein MYCODSM44623_05579 (plasmid) [Mycobacterium intracellulare subsp. chimaera]|uniref:Uncharacterized protein n=1 Tax=Mycobacterium intracellulare subsp. chimaera TaxID=222805 RepID=A0A7U5MR52_MYCIT|nr:hypothetical protein MYCODSM44623_05579 [Mycobacterium intracellulare subsp. chimaera]ASL18154.1 hypothetical protein MYCOZU2_05809 [Mycobacterium intracellulare subsp. chimaera]
MSSPWSRTGSPSVTLPPPPASSPTPGATPPPAAPFPSAFLQGSGPRRRVSARIALGLLLAIVLSAVVTATITVVAMRSDSRVQPGGQPSVALAAPNSASPTPQFSPAESAAAKQNLCHVFDVSAGQKGQGGYRVEGNLNMPVTLQAVTSAVAVQNALVPAVPADVASAARRYITTTLDVATAAMGNTSINEINRLTAVSNGAVDALVDVCGLPR